jgi:hypothetical protein
VAETGLVLYTGAHLVMGQVDPGRRRLSDHLNDPQRAYLEVAQAQWYNLMAETGPPGMAPLLTLRKERVQIAIPQDVPAPGTARAPTQQLPLELGFPLFLVRGGVHRRNSDPSSPSTCSPTAAGSSCRSPTPRCAICRTIASTRRNPWS